MDRLACMHSFVRVVETGSFSAVARELQTTQPTVSKQIAVLETHLGAQLLVRSTRHLHLTEEGERFYAHCLRLLEVAAEAEASVGRREHPFGTLRLTCPVMFGQLQIVPRLQAFLQRYPDVRIDLEMSDRPVDLLEEGLDLAIRIGGGGDPLYLWERLGTTRRVTVAAPEYFARAGKPETPAELQRHNCIIYTPSGDTWHFEGPQGPVQVTVGGNLRINSSAAVRAAVLSGLGIAVSALWLFADALACQEVCSVLEAYQPTALPIYAVCRRNRFQSAKVRCFIAFVAEAFRQEPALADR